MKKTQEKNMKNDNLAAIGIGAMIVFIALILVAAVAAAVIIQTAEKLQQNAQSTGDDTTDEMSGKVQVLNVFVADGDQSRSTSVWLLVPMIQQIQTSSSRSSVTMVLQEWIELPVISAIRQLIHSLVLQR